MKKIIAMTVFLALFTNSCIIGPQTFHPTTYIQPKPRYLVICKPTPDNGVYIWKKDCLVFNKE